MTILIIGADGRIGSVLMAELKRCGHAVIGTTRRENGNGRFFDLATPSFSKIQDDVDVVYICAGITGDRACGQGPDVRQVNVDGTIATIRHFARSGAKVVFLSSSAAARPSTSIYGAMKIEVEDAVAEMARTWNVHSIRFGPVIPREGGAYADGDYPPIHIDALVAALASYAND